MAIRLAGTRALLNTLEFARQNFEVEAERSFIMQTICEATQSEAIKARALEAEVAALKAHVAALKAEREAAPAETAETAETAPPGRLGPPPRSPLLPSPLLPSSLPPSPPPPSSAMAGGHQSEAKLTRRLP